jgi:hypothetical protein
MAATPAGAHPAPEPVPTTEQRTAGAPHGPASGQTTPMVPKTAGVLHLLYSQKNAGQRSLGSNGAACHRPDLLPIIATR